MSSEPKKFTVGLFGTMIMALLILNVYSETYTLITVSGTVVSDVRISTLEPSNPNTYYVFEFKVESSSNAVFQKGEIIKYVWMQSDKFDSPMKEQELTISGYWVDIGYEDRKEGYFNVQSVQEVEMIDWGSQLFDYLVDNPIVILVVGLILVMLIGGFKHK